MISIISMPSPSIFVDCKRSKTGAGQGLGTRLGLVMQVHTIRVLHLVSSWTLPLTSCYRSKDVRGSCLGKRRRLVIPTLGAGRRLVVSILGKRKRLMVSTLGKRKRLVVPAL